jgi:hypothetical protein
MSIEEAEERCRALLHVVLAVAHLNRREEREIKEAREGLPGVEPGRHGKPLPVPRMRVCC